MSWGRPVFTAQRGAARRVVGSQGGPPPLGDPVYQDIEAYAFWLASGAPPGQKLPGAGYPKMAKTELGFDYNRGAKVYAQNCALCHGTEGQNAQSYYGKEVRGKVLGQGISREQAAVAAH